MRFSVSNFGSLAFALASVAFLNARVTTQAAAPATPQGIITMRTYAGDVRTAVRNGTASADGVFYPKRMEGPYNNFPDEDPGDDTAVPVDERDGYTTELVGYFYPPKTGKIQFAISTDDPGALYFSTDDDPSKKVQIATEPTWNGKRSFAAEARRTRVNDGTEPVDRLINQSAWINVTANKPYFIQCISNEGGGGDNNAVAFRYEGDADFADGDLPILGQYLSTIDRGNLADAYLATFGPSATGYTALIKDGSGAGAKSLDPASVTTQLDGSSVPSTATKVTGGVSVVVKTSTVFGSGSSHTAVIAGKDNTGASLTFNQAFQAPTFTLIPKALKVTPNTAQPGFIWRVFQNAANQANNNNRTEDALAGRLKDGDGNPLPNQADPSAQGPSPSAGTKLGSADNALIEFVIPQVINFDQAAGSNGFATPDEQMPGIPGTDGGADGIAAEIITFLDLPAGEVVMGVNSDDGFLTGVGEAGDLFNPPLKVGEFNGGRGASDTIFRLVTEEAGVYAFRTTWEEGGGGANIEWFTVKGDGSKVLVNDTANGGVKAYRSRTAAGQKAKGISADPGLNTGGMAYDATITLKLEDGETPVATSSVGLKINGATVPATVTKDAKITTITYKSPTPYQPKTKLNVELSYTEGTTVVTRSWYYVTLNQDMIGYWSFDDASDPKKALDSAGGHTATLEGPAKFTADAGGRSAKAGDRALDLGTDGTGARASVTDVAAAFLNDAAVQDQMAVSFWSKQSEIRNSSTFFMGGPSSDRYFHAHAPWGDGTIYFDTVACCDGTQRIQKSLNDWPDAGGDNAAYLANWHLFIFQKNRANKQMYIDGKLYHEGENTAILPTNFDRLFIGSWSGANEAIRGMVDEFAIYATPLSAKEIADLAAGKRPDELGRTTPGTGGGGGEAKFTGVVKNADGSITISWDGGGTLEASANVTGPWAAVPGATSPYKFTPSGATTFGRIKK